DWYMNGNYLVILVSVTIILPLALMKQLGYLGYASGFSLSYSAIWVWDLRWGTMVGWVIRPSVAGWWVIGPGDTSFRRLGRGIQPLSTHPLCTPGCSSITPPCWASAQCQWVPWSGLGCAEPTVSRSPSKKKMQCISNISIMVMYLMYFLAALFGYLTFYGRVESELLHTYNKVDPFDVLILCVRVAVLTAVTLTVPIVLFPV
ncbi:Sodium-coupled neutral amino acid transporter 3, partial [Apaloderma vittatum]